MEHNTTLDPTPALSNCIEVPSCVTQFGPDRSLVLEVKTNGFTQVRGRGIP